MRRPCLTLLIGFVLIANGFPALADLTEKQRIDDATALVNLYIHRYAPLPWKKELLGLPFDDVANELMEAAATAASDPEFYDAILHFIARLQDAHVSGHLPSSKVSRLGFTVDDFNGTVLITDIDRKDLPEENFPFQIGDRLLSMDGHNVNALIKQFAVYGVTGSALADRRTAARLLTFREQERVPEIPRGETDLGIFSPSSKQRGRVRLPWKHEGYALAPFRERMSLSKNAATLPASRDLDDVSAPFIDGPFASLYTKAPFFPLWSTFVMRTTDPFLSGIVILDGHRIGYLRLHTWSAKRLKLSSAKEILPFFDKEIAFLEEETEALIIDQTSNPGGSVCLVEAAVSYFVPKALSAIGFSIKPTRKWLTEFEGELLKAKTEEDRLRATEYVRHIRRALAAGKELTDPLPLCGYDGLIHPRKTDSGKQIAYTKPILLLINEINCSGGDAFPAMMQDLTQAVTFGARTIGCGGNVVDVEALGHSDVTVRVTESLMVRPKPVRLPNGKETRYIENVGVTPDIPYTITAEDFYNGYEKYRNTIKDVMLEMISPDYEASAFASRRAWEAK